MNGSYLLGQLGFGNAASVAICRSFFFFWVGIFIRTWALRDGKDWLGKKDIHEA